MKRHPTLHECIEVLTEARHMLANCAMIYSGEAKKIKKAQLLLGRMIIVEAQLREAEERRKEMCDNPKCPFDVAPPVQSAPSSTSCTVGEGQ